MAQTVVDEVMLREPRLLVPGRQPLGPVRASELAKKLANQFGGLVVVFAGPMAFVDLISGKPATSVTYTTQKQAVFNGMMGYNPTTNGSVASAAFSPIPNKGSGASVVLQISGPYYFRGDAIVGCGAGGVRGFNTSLGSMSDPAYSDSGAAIPKPTFTHFGVAGYQSTVSLSASPKASVVSYVVTSGANSTFDLFEKGANIESQAVGNFVAWSSSDAVVIGMPTTSYALFYGGISIAAVFGGKLPSAIAAMLSVDPFALVEPA